jgi:hypothetical protein
MNSLDTLKTFRVGSLAGAGIFTAMGISSILTAAEHGDPFAQETLIDEMSLIIALVFLGLYALSHLAISQGVRGAYYSEKLSEKGNYVEIH